MPRPSGHTGVQYPLQLGFPSSSGCSTARWGGGGDGRRVAVGPPASNTGGVVGIPRSSSMGGIHMSPQIGFGAHPSFSCNEDLPSSYPLSLGSPLGRGSYSPDRTVAPPRSRSPLADADTHVHTNAQGHGRWGSSPNLAQIESNPSIHLLSSQVVKPPMLNTNSHRRHTMIDLSKPTNFIGQEGLKPRRDGIAKEPTEERVIVSAWQRNEAKTEASQDSAGIEHPHPFERRTSSPRFLDLEKLDERHRESLSRLQSSVTLAFEGEAMKKQLVERMQREAKEMAERERLRAERIAAMSHSSWFKFRSKSKLKIKTNKLQARRREEDRGFFSKLFSCYSGKSGHGRVASKGNDGPTPDDEKLEFDSPHSVSRLRLELTASATGSLDKVAEWNVSRGGGSPVSAMRRTETHSPVLKPTGNGVSRMTVKKESKHSWLEY